MGTLRRLDIRLGHGARTCALLWLGAVGLAPSVAAPAGSEGAKVLTYPGPKGEEASDDFAVSVGGSEVFVYRARVSAVPFNQVWPGYQRPINQTEIASFAYWDMGAAVAVEVVSKRPVKTVAVRPTSYGIRPRVAGNRISFDLDRPRQITVEINGTHRALHLFANPPEKGAPAPGDPNVLYFGPGVHRPGKIHLQTGQTLYVAGGAVVHTAVEATEARDIAVRGRGIIDVSTFKRMEGGGAISLHGCSNVRIEGVVCRDPDVWTIIPAGCRDVRIANVKLIGLWRYNADGIDVCNSQRVRIENCFVRSFDDSIVIKGLPAWRKYRTGHLPVRDVQVRGCVVWNDWGRAFEIGAETSTPEIRDVTFEDCDIIRTAEVALDVQHGDRAEIRNLRFQGIRLEIDDEAYPPKMQRSRDEKYGLPRGSHRPRLLVLSIRKNAWSRDERRGRLRNVLVKDVSVTGRHFPESRLHGCDAEHQVENVTIENLRVNGRRITSAEKGRVQIGKHVRNVRFAPAGDASGAEEPLSRLGDEPHEMDNFRRPKDDPELRFWLENMVWHHGFSVREIRAATGMSAKDVAAALERLKITAGTKPPRPADAALRVLPYPGGRHPRIGFLDGAVRPQRETKCSVFAPWDKSGYIVVDVPEAIWWDTPRGRELLYLAHTHIPTHWDRSGAKLAKLEWKRHRDGTLSYERRLPNDVAFGSRVVPGRDAVRMEMWLRNGTKQKLTGLDVQNCVMLKGAPEFAARTNENKVYRSPYAACRSAKANRWVITAWQPPHRTWGNQRCPCLHSDPRFPDCPPGRTVRIRGWLSFYQGDDVQAEFERIDRSWRRKGP
jgi:hypothetical protein